jgi:hypothetical protein
MCTCFVARDSCHFNIMTVKANVPLGLGYALSLNTIRAYQSVLSSPQDSDICPDDVESSVEIWGDGLRTLCFAFDESTRVKHIYTCNKEELQEEPTFLLREFQMNVALSREHGAHASFACVRCPSI